MLFDGGKLRHGRFPEFGAAGLQALVVDLEFFEEAKKAALGGGFVAGEIREEFLVLVGPMVGVSGEFPFDFFEAIGSALEEPVGAGSFFNKCDGDGILRLVEMEPGGDGGFKFGGIFERHKIEGD